MSLFDYQMKLHLHDGIIHTDPNKSRDEDQLIKVKYFGEIASSDLEYRQDDESVAHP